MYTKGPDVDNMYNENFERRSETAYEALGYIRVSTDAQVDGSSLEWQKHRIETYCAEQGWTLVEIFTDVGSGADTEDRPEFKRLMKVIRKHHLIVACKVDRLGRNAKEVLELLDYLKKLSRGLRVIEFPIDPFNFIGRFAFTMLAGVAELERQLIMERTAMGRVAKSQKGGYAYGAPPFGWRVIEGELVEDSTEQGVIRTIRQLRKWRWSLRDIANRLTSDGFKTKRGGSWHASIISKILKGKGKNAK